MKILIINSRYFLSAGPEKYMFGITPVLQKHGHTVIPFSVKNSKNLETPYAKYFADPIGGGDKVYFNEYNKDIKTIAEIMGRQYYSFHVAKRLEKLIKDTKPDIAYLLHHYNKMSPSVIDVCKKMGIPVVMRLSDFFMVCPEGHLYRDHKICEDCIDKSLFEAVRHRCVKGSLAGSVIKASAMAFHRMIGIYRKVDYIVSPSQHTIEKVAKFVDTKRLVHIPTFVLGTERENKKLGDYALFVGRTEENKGVLTAIKAFEGTKHRLVIVGKSSTGYDEVLESYVKSNKLKNIELVGAKFGKELEKLFRNSRMVLQPALWYENMPNVALEAMIHSRPILASDHGSYKDIVHNGKNGLLFVPGDAEDLRRKAEKLFSDSTLCRKLGHGSYLEATKVYDPEVHYQRLMKIFEKVVR